MFRLKTAACQQHVAIVIVAAASPASAAVSCTDLASLKIPASEIGLPAARLQRSPSAQMATVAADPSNPATTRDYCKVAGAVAAGGPECTPINFGGQPARRLWNEMPCNTAAAVEWRAHHRLAPLSDARRDTPCRCARLCDLGTDFRPRQHETRRAAALFAVNDEALVNMAYPPTRRPETLACWDRHCVHGRAPAKTYSTAAMRRSRALTTQRFLSDFDGIGGGGAVSNYTGANLMRRRSSHSSSAKAAVDQSGQGQADHNAVNAACDKLDGLDDGVISAYEKCLSTFDVGTLRCVTVRTRTIPAFLTSRLSRRLVHRPYQYPFAMKNGVTAFSRMDLWQRGAAGRYGRHHNRRGATAIPIKDTKIQSVAWVNAGRFWLRLYFARDAKFDPFQFRAEEFAGRIRRFRSCSTLPIRTSRLSSAWRQADFDKATGPTINVASGRRSTTTIGCRNGSDRRGSVSCASM